MKDILKSNKGMDLLAIGILLLNIAVYYLLVPFLVVKVLAIFGIAISYLNAVIILTLAYILFGVVRKL